MLLKVAYLLNWVLTTFLWSSHWEKEASTLCEIKVTWKSWLTLCHGIRWETVGCKSRSFIEQFRQTNQNNIQKSQAETRSIQQQTGISRVRLIKTERQGKDQRTRTITITWLGNECIIKQCFSRDKVWGDNLNSTGKWKQVQTIKSHVTGIWEVQGSTGTWSLRWPCS